MGMQTCAACGDKARKTQTAMLLDAGALRGARVCASCRRRGVLIVPLARSLAAKLDAGAIVRAEERGRKGAIAGPLAKLEGLIRAGRVAAEACEDGDARLVWDVKIEAWEGLAMLLRTGVA